jgi:hypothetical protein
MDHIIEKERKTKVRLDCDVLVAGGGTAGLVAALAAARNGAKTVLVERYGSLGGTLINGATVLHSFFNLYKAFPGVAKKQLVRGIPQEIVDRMIAAGGCPGHLEQSRGYDYDSIATCFDHEIFKTVMPGMIEEAGIKLLMHTLVADAVTDGNSVKGLVVETKSGREALLGQVTVDATGDGDVAYKSGVPCHNLSKQHNVGLIFGMANVDLKKTVNYLTEKGILTQLVRGNKGNDKDDIVRIGLDLKKIEPFREFMEPRGMWGPLTASVSENNLTYINCTNVGPVDAVDVESLTWAEMELRKQISGMATLLKKHMPGFERGYLGWTCIGMGIRRSRWVECEYDIPLTDIENAVQHDDDVALYGFHDCAPRHVVKNGGAYGIPYRALLPKGVENLLMAGRMITSEYLPHMSTRNTVSCMAQGQAVGTAAAMCSKLGVSPRQLSVADIRKALVHDGAYLGE